MLIRFRSFVFVSAQKELHCKHWWARTGTIAGFGIHGRHEKKQTDAQGQCVALAWHAMRFSFWVDIAFVFVFVFVFVFKVGDPVYARVTLAHRDIDPMVSCVDESAKVNVCPRDPIHIHMKTLSHA